MRVWSVDAIRTLPTAHAPRRGMPCGTGCTSGAVPNVSVSSSARWAEELADATRKNG